MSIIPVSEQRVSQYQVPPVRTFTSETEWYWERDSSVVLKNADNTDNADTVNYGCDADADTGN